jgi:hypothetical protein
MVTKSTKNYKFMQVFFIINIVCLLHVSVIFVAFLREVHYEGYITEVFDLVHKCKIHLSVFVLHELGLDRSVSASSNSFFKVLPSRLHSFGLQFSTIFGILLFSLVTCRSQFDLCLLRFRSTASTVNSSKIFSFLSLSKRVYPAVILKNFISTGVNSFLFSFFF